MPKRINKNQPATYSELEKLLSQQATIILDAIDVRIGKSELKIDKRFELTDKRFELIEKRIDKMEERINKKIDRLTTTLDKFLKRMSDIEDELKIMKADINRLKKIISEKLGVEIL